jgi:DNA processing protein
MSPLEALVALNMLPKIGPVRVRRLLEAFGDPAAVLGAPKDRLMRVDGIGEETAKILHGWQDHADPAAEIGEAGARGIEIVTQDDEAYPSPLREAYDPPLLLYVWGKIEPRDKHAIAMVGSRRTTNYGTQAAKKPTMGPPN